MTQSAPYRPQVQLTPDLDPEAPRQAPPELAELTPEQWALWRQHPVSQLLLRRYLPDWRGALERQTLTGWVYGRLSLNAEQEARGYLLAINLIEGLGLNQVREFYGIGPWQQPTQQRPPAPLGWRP